MTWVFVVFDRTLSSEYEIEYKNDFAILVNQLSATFSATVAQRLNPTLCQSTRNLVALPNSYMMFIQNVKLESH